VVAAAIFGTSVLVVEAIGDEGEARNGGHQSPETGTDHTQPAGHD